MGAMAAVRLRASCALWSFDRLLLTLPGVRFRTGTFAAYANATLADVLGPDLTGARRLEAATLDHEGFLNRGGRFEAVPLPAEAQLAPALYAGVAHLADAGPGALCSCT